MQLLDCNLNNAKINELLKIIVNDDSISEENDYYDITQGHDFLGYLQSICSYFPRYKKLDSEKLHDSIKPHHP